MNPVQIVNQVFAKKRTAFGVYEKQRRAVLFSFLLFAGVPIFYSCLAGEISWSAMARSGKIVSFYYPETSKYTVVFETSYGQLEMDMDAAVACLLPAVIPADYEEEAIKAQAILLRTELIQNYKENEEIQKNSPYTIYFQENQRTKNYFTFLEQKKYYGENYQKNLERYRQAATETAGMYLKRTDSTFEVAEIESADTKATEIESVEIKATEMKAVDTGWFRVSAGNTREGLLCEKDYLSENYYNDTLITQTEFQNTMRQLYEMQTEKPAESASKEIAEIHFQKFLEGDVENNAQDATDNDTQDAANVISYGRALLFVIHFMDETKQEFKVEPEKFCDAFNLLSPYIDTVVETKTEVIVTVKGVGHGSGMSQFGANEMAKEGKKYTEILNYFFTNIAIDKFE